MKDLPKISDSEWLVMKVLWKESPLKAIEVIKRLDNISNWKPITKKTLNWRRALLYLDTTFIKIAYSL